MEIEIYKKGGTIKDKVIEHQDILKAMKTHGELYRWAKENEMDNRSAFPKFKIALNEIGIDYDSIKEGIHKERENEIKSKLKYEVTLYSDAKASKDRFAITDEDGDVLWYGKFFDSDSDYDGEQSSGELAAAKKAVWLASKIKEAINEEVIRLNLFVDAQWLLYQDHAGQKGYELTRLAKKYNIDLNIEWVPGENNPADTYTTESGFKKWSDNDLTSLASEIINNNEEDAIIESENIIPSEINTNDGTKGGIVEGNTHEDGGVPAIIKETDTPIEVEKDETVINATSMKDEDTYTVTGTPIQIASAINAIDGNGVDFAKGAEIEKVEDVETKENTDALKKEIQESITKLLQEVSKENRHLLTKHKLREIEQKLDNLISDYWTDVVSVNPKELTEFLEFQKDIPKRYSIMMRYAYLDTSENSDNSNEFINNLKTNIWSLIPEDFKNHKMPKKVSYKPVHTDKGLYELAKDFISHDLVRPSITGVRFDKKGIIATDAHKLLFLYQPDDKREEKIYCIEKNCLEINNNDVIVEHKYPNYEFAISDHENFVSIHTESLITYLKTVIDIEYFNSFTKPAFIKFDNDLFIAFNVTYLLTAAKAMYKLGYEQIDIGYSHAARGILMCNKGELRNVKKLKTDFVLVMPISTYEVFKGTMYFDATSECVATTDIEDVSCINPVHIQKQEMNNVLNETKEILKKIETINEKKETESKQKNEADKKTLELRLKLLKKVHGKNPSPKIKTRIKILEKMLKVKMEFGGMIGESCGCTN
ncbi:MAG: hypothetical protein IT243_06130 [Bacteroidia bacterium]|nr:hypothetical protein [Bacteroidia bacterium]